MFICCSECGKKLIFRREDGSLVFRFGKTHKEKPIVDMELVGSGTIKLKCLRRSCPHITEVSQTIN
jgi:hypothetical protein